MTKQQIKASEEIVENIINQKQKVYAKDAPLAKASAIQGLRQVFAEVGKYISISVIIFVSDI